MRKSRLLAVVAFVLLLQFGMRSAADPQPSAQQGMPPAIPDASQPGQLPGMHEPQIGPDERTQKEMEKGRRKERWRDIKKDSERLLEVATELKQYVDKSGENVMSLEVIRKAQEMEKLSKDLQKKMKGQ